MNARNSVQPETAAHVSVTPGLRKIIAADWKLILIGALLSFFLASVLMSGTPAGLIPNLSVPFSYGGDGLFHAWMAQRVDEGWLFENARSGYPFGSNFLDFPGADGGDHLIIKLTSLLGGGWVAGVNLFFLLGFATCFIATYVTARAFGLNRSFSVAAGAIYTFAPFHFLRLQHLFYTWYFVAPLFFYLALSIYRTQRPSEAVRVRSTPAKLLLTAIGMLVLASFGVYYALFGIIILALAGILSAVSSGHLHGTLKAALLSIAVVAGVGVNIAPNLLGNLSQGPNPEVAKRSPIESEVYGLKLMQLLMPRADHRSSVLRDGAQRYNAAAPLSNENVTASLGVIGSAGFMLALLVIALSPARLQIDERLRLLAAITFVLFMFATIGGLGALFAIAVSPSIRGWNRASIFIACAAVLFFFVALQCLLEKKAPRLGKYSAVIASVLILIGFYDQTTRPCRECNANQKVAFENDKHFIQSIENALHAGAAVYQLPYIGFPEVPIQHKLLNYQMMNGVLHSKALHWSFGGMKGRPGDLFYRALANEPMARQLEVIRELGFEGIYVDRRGYTDNGNAVIDEISQLLKAQPLLQNASGELVFFKLNDSAHPQLNGLSPMQIMQQAKFYADASGPRYPGNLTDGIDFAKPGLPDFISSATGLSSAESWGRWSDQGKIKFEFFQPLPQSFTLIVKARAFASNAQKPTRVIIGDREYDIQLSGGVTEIRLAVEGANANSITFIPPSPVSPHQLDGNSADRRMIGIGFVSLQIEH